MIKKNFNAANKNNNNKKKKNKKDRINNFRGKV